MKNITRALVLPLLSAGVIGGAALGLAGPATAATTTTHTNGSHSIVTTPDTRATDNAHGGQQLHSPHFRGESPHTKKKLGDKGEQG